MSDEFNAFHNYLNSIILVILAVISGCETSNADRNIYKDDRVFNYRVIYFDTNGDVTDSCNLDMIVGEMHLVNLLMLEQTPLVYKMREGCCEDDNTQATGLIEDESQVFIHPPRLKCLSFTALYPMPTVHLPLSLYTSSTTELTVGKSNHEGLTGKVLKLKEEMVGKTIFNYKGEQLEVYEKHGENTNCISEFGVNKSEYLFNEKLGFVSMTYYRPDGEKVLIVLRNTNF